MTRVESILLRVRDVLADHRAERWSDDTLLRLFNDGLQNFILQAGTLKLKTFIELEQNTPVYDLSPYVISIDRVQYTEKVLEAKTEEEMDEMGLDWQTHVGKEPKIVVFDNLKLGVFRLYPIVSDNTLNNITANNDYGILIDIITFDDLYKLPSFGDAPTDGVKYLTVYYIGKPREVLMSSTDDELDLDVVYDEAMVAFISGQALRFDADTLNRQFGAEQLSIFKSYVDQAKVKESRANNTFNRRHIPYKGFI